MPNNVTNIIKPDGDFSMVDVVTPYLTDGELDFNKIEPVPQELLRVSAPTRIVSEEEYQKILQDPAYSDPNKRFPISEEKQGDLYAKYDYDNWYDWCKENWGTHRNSYDSFESLDAEGMSFYTADSPAVTAIEKLSVLTGKSFKMLYCGDGKSFMGCVDINPKESKESFYSFQQAPQWLKDIFFEQDDQEEVYEEEVE